MRVPSANRSWIEVDGRVVSRTRPPEGEEEVTGGVSVAVLEVFVSSVLLLLLLLPPRVLPTP